MGVDGEARMDGLPVRRPPGETFDEALSAAIAAKGVTLSALRRRLAARRCSISLSTLSYWRTGERRPEHSTSLDAVVALEEILGLDDGDLVNRLGPSRRPGPTPERLSMVELMNVDDRLVNAFESLDLAEPDDLLRLSTHTTIDVDENAMVSRIRMRALLRALRDGADRIPVVIRSDDPTEGPVRFRALFGGRLSQISSSDPRIHGSDFVLERPLHTGETAVIEHETLIPEPTVFDYYEQYLTHRVGETLVWIRFHPERLPRTCELYRRVQDSEAVTPVDVTSLTAVHHLVRGFGPGAVGIRLTW